VRIDLILDPRLANIWSSNVKDAQEWFDKRLDDAIKAVETLENDDTGRHVDF